MKKKKETRKLMNFKVNKEEMRAIKKLAKKNCNGNISKWIRLSAQTDL